MWGDQWSGYGVSTGVAVLELADRGAVHCWVLQPLECLQQVALLPIAAAAWLLCSLLMLFADAL